MRITVREATSDDNAALLALTRSASMEGEVGLRIDREPDFFRLLRLRGDGAVLVATDGDRLVGCVSIASRLVFVDRAPRRVHYLGDLKAHPSVRGSRVTIRLLSALHRYVAAQGGDLVFCVVSDGNTTVYGLLQGRLGIPGFEPMGRFSVYEIPASPWQGRSRYRIAPAGAADVPALRRLVHRFNAAYQLAPVFTEADWLAYVEESEAGGPLRVWTARAGDAIRALLCTFDAAFAKQHVVTGLSTGLRAAVAASRVLGRIAPVVPFPRPGEPVPLLYLRHPAYEEGHEAALRALIRHARRHAYRRRYPFVVIGLHERDPMQAVFRRFIRLTVGSRGFVTSLREDRALLDRICAGVPVEDYALA